jgi:cytidylate kinase
VADVWLITGAQASGKSTVADRLAATFERGAHVRGGQFYRMVRRGWVPFDDAERPEEARRCLDLRYRLSAQAAATYADAGFTCVVQDNIYGGDVSTWLEAVRPRQVRLVVLRPSVEVLQARDADRREATGKIAYRGSFTPAVNDAHLAATPQLGLWLDTSAQTPEETVAEIRQREAEAIVAPASQR